MFLTIFEDAYISQFSSSAGFSGGLHPKEIENVTNWNHYWANRFQVQKTIEESYEACLRKWQGVEEPLRGPKPQKIRVYPILQHDLLVYGAGRSRIMLLLDYEREETSIFFSLPEDPRVTIHPRMNLLLPWDWDFAGIVGRAASLALPEEVIRGEIFPALTQIRV